ncbi:YqaJ viral recombinase family protein [Xenophilus sp. Marseille-Q4582]|uniref:YqaJ viral recombinase family nuclease n=1 Tax=Xenophilus sp. Marseille-Q4582 TaxID=2866600 RepID=UPI001CE42123|nr:YqaJ viral recombinase family protein [Xenophilus sp. Marseille-Q4582]
MNAVAEQPVRDAAVAADRRHFLGGSDAASVLGISPWKTPFQLWQQKTQPFDEVEVITPQKQRIFKRGHRMEPYVVDLLSEETGLQITRRNQRYIDPEFPFLAAEIDAEAATGENVEIKTVSPFKASEWGEMDTDAIPVHYTAQAQHGLMITGAPVCVFGVLIGGDDFRVYRVERDDQVIAALRQREVSFWRDYVETLTPPPAVNPDDLARMFPKDIGTAVEATESALIAYNEIKALRPQLKELEARIEEHQDTLRAAMGPAARLLMDGQEIASWKTQSATRFDQSAFKAAHPDLAALFMKTTESRVLRLK